MFHECHFSSSSSYISQIIYFSPLHDLLPMQRKRLFEGFCISSNFLIGGRPRRDKRPSLSGFGFQFVTILVVFLLLIVILRSL